MIVVDTNIQVYLWLRMPQTRDAERLYAKDPHWIAPLLWRSEFRNALLLYVRKKAMAFDEAMYAIERAEARMRDYERMVDSRAVMTLAASSGCTAYDCEFVALAEAAGVPLITSDARLLKSFPEIAQLLPGSID